jgi:RNA polymerase sigma-32 factor
MARNAVPPILTDEPGLTHYLEEIRRFPMLERQEEYLLAKRWREHGERDTAHKLSRPWKPPPMTIPPRRSR